MSLAHILRDRLRDMHIGACMMVDVSLMRVTR